MLEYLGFHQSFAHRAEAVPSDPGGDTVVCGHTHMTFVRLAHGRLVSNPSSIGMPYGRTGARWALGPGVEQPRGLRAGRNTVPGVASSPARATAALTTRKYLAAWQGRSGDAAGTAQALADPRGASIRR